jgi:hypothetical protein
MVGLVFTVTVITFGVAQAPHPGEEMESQLPPVAVAEVYVKLNAVPGVAIVKVCGSGSAPPYGFVKLIGLTWLNTLGPTRTLMGMVTLLPFA